MTGGIGAFIIGISAIGGGGGASGPGFGFGYERIDDLSESRLLSPPDGATSALVAVELAAVRYRDDGEPPSADDGMPMAVGEKMVLAGAAIAATMFIQQIAGARLSVLYYGGADDGGEDEGGI